jgi:hypothetical protein
VRRNGCSYDTEEGFKIKFTRNEACETLQNKMHSHVLEDIKKTRKSW